MDTEEATSMACWRDGIVWKQYEWERGGDIEWSAAGRCTWQGSLRSITVRSGALLSWGRTCSLSLTH